MSAICFNNVLKTKPKEHLENAATKIKDDLSTAQKALDNAKSKDLSDLKQELNDKLARLDELNLYVGCVDKNSPNDAILARLEARYGKDYADIVREKIDKENADEMLDISFAPKRSDERALNEKPQNLGIMSQKQQGKSMDLSEFLNENGAVDYQKLENLAVNLPSSLNYKKFLGQFDNDSKAIIKTPIADLEVNPRYMFYHLTKDGDKKGNFKGNTKENRIYLSGGVLETLQKPLFITQDKSGTIYFYKAFKNNKGLINLISIAVPKNNSKMFYRTSYNGSNSRISILIKEHTLIYKAD